MKRVINICRNCEKEIEYILNFTGLTNEYLKEVNYQLWSLGIEKIILEGKIQLHTGVYVLGKGQNSIVVKCVLFGNEYACKIKRPDSPREDLLHEVYALKIANSVNIGPKLIAYTRYVEVLELINGVEIEKWIESEHTSNELLNILEQIFEQTYKLDKIGLVHQELSRAHEHLIITNDLNVKIIDFETCSLTSKKSNLTQVVNALIMSGSRIANYFRTKLSLDNNDLTKIRELLIEYKRSRSWEIIERVLNVIKSKCSE